MFKDKIKKALQNANLDGFTTPLKGELKRYIVAYTNNTSNISIDYLNWQATFLENNNSNLNIWGWKDKKTGKVYLDISTSTDDLELALNIAKHYNQIAIWDNKNQEEIRVK